MALAHFRRVALAFLAAAAAAAAPSLAAASCIPVAQLPARVFPAALTLAELAQGDVRLTYVGHATFLIETSGGAKAVTDYNGYVRPQALPDIATMNNAHST